MPVPAQPKIYHIVHVDRLASIIADGCLWSDAMMDQRQGVGTTIGMGSIKARRLMDLPGLPPRYCMWAIASRSIFVRVRSCCM